MVQSPASAIILVIAAIGVASSLAFPFEQGVDDLGVIKRIFDKDPNVRAVTNSEPQNPQSTPGSGTHSSVPSGHSSSPVAHSSGSVTLPSGHGPEITSSTLDTSKSPGRTKTHYGSPDQTTTMHSIATSAPHCHGMNSSTRGGGGGYENHSKHSPHPSSNPGAPPPSGSAKPTSAKPPLDRRAVTQSSSLPSESGHSGHSVKSDAPSSAHASATHQSGGQEPHMTPTDGQTQPTTVTGKHGGEPTGRPTAGDNSGNKGGHGGRHGEGSGPGKGGGHHRRGDGGHKGSQDGSSPVPKSSEGGDNHGHQGTSSANEGGHGATSSSGNSDPVQTKGQRSMFRREPSLDELD